MFLSSTQHRKNAEKHVEEGWNFSFLGWHYDHQPLTTNSKEYQISAKSVGAFRSYVQNTYFYMGVTCWSGTPKKFDSQGPSLNLKHTF